MDLAAAFPEFGASTPFYEPPQVPQHQFSQSQGYQQQGQATFNAALQTTQSAEQPVVYGASGAPMLPSLPPPQTAPPSQKKQGFTDMDGGRSRRELQYKKAAYTVLTFLLALALDRVAGLYLDDYLATAGFEPNRTFISWMMYPAVLLAALWIVLR